jgi:hypothetical protein
MKPLLLALALACAGQAGAACGLIPARIAQGVIAAPLGLSKQCNFSLVDFAEGMGGYNWAEGYYIDPRRYAVIRRQVLDELKTVGYRHITTKVTDYVETLGYCNLSGEGLCMTVQFEKYGQYPQLYLGGAQ